MTGVPRRADRTERVEIAIVGGGLAGAALATRLARTGRSVTVLERMPSWRWRAAGVFASPAAVAALRRLGMSEPALAEMARPIPAMRVETPRGTTFRLTYGADQAGSLPDDMAVGFDRSRLDPALLELAASAGADVRPGSNVVGLDLVRSRLDVRAPDGSGERGSTPA